MIKHPNVNDNNHRSYLTNDPSEASKIRGPKYEGKRRISAEACSPRPRI